VSDRPLPLEGNRILEPGVLLAAPFASALMADFGADVIKIEVAGSGVPLCAVGPFHKGCIAVWKVLPGTKSVTLDLRKSRGQRLSREPTRTADVVIENVRPGVMDKWGIGW
jgi:crotonobetainyl-CoA:carnitine CoA-transferase CaiB-like acyl-CoA transferase